MLCVNGEKFRQALINVANESNLPISLAYFITLNFCNQLKDLYQQELQKEMSGENEEIAQFDITPEMFEEQEE